MLGGGGSSEALRFPNFKLSTLLVLYFSLNTLSKASMQTNIT